MPGAGLLPAGRCGVAQVQDDSLPGGGAGLNGAQDLLELLSGTFPGVYEADMSVAIFQWVVGHALHGIFFQGQFKIQGFSQTGPD